MNPSGQLEVLCIPLVSIPLLEMKWHNTALQERGLFLLLFSSFVQEYRTVSSARCFEEGKKKGKKNLTHESEGLLLAFCSHSTDHIQAPKNSSTLKTDCIKLSPRSTDLLLGDRCWLSQTSLCWLFISTELCWDRSGTAGGSWILSFTPAAPLSCNYSHLSKPTGTNRLHTRASRVPGQILSQAEPQLL